MLEKGVPRLIDVSLLPLFLEGGLVQGNDMSPVRREAVVLTYAITNFTPSKNIKQKLNKRAFANFVKMAVSSFNIRVNIMHRFK